VSAWSRTRAELGEERIDVLDELDMETWLADQAGDPLDAIDRLLEETEELTDEQADVVTEEIPRPPRAV
jgi:hypothetical protein